MTARVPVMVNGKPVEVPAGCSVAAAIALAGQAFRRSLTGEPRYPMCGMGVCFECRVNVDGVAHQQACMLPVREGMRVVTDG